MNTGQLMSGPPTKLEQQVEKEVEHDDHDNIVYISTVKEDYGL
jgi:hypothetical protein